MWSGMKEVSERTVGGLSCATSREVSRLEIKDVAVLIVERYAWACCIENRRRLAVARGGEL